MCYAVIIAKKDWRAGRGLGERAAKKGDYSSKREVAMDI